ncbi:MAG: hypothetical protein KGY38_03190 [Desulfobacterales bacterium]|nr:hypothetical protein [Desulfobacterales bacterium]
MYIVRDIFDFETGWLAKSPCKECSRINELPECSDECRVLDQIRILLARGVSCTGNHHFTEP